MKLLVAAIAVIVLSGCATPKYDINWPVSNNPWNGGDSSGGDGSSGSSE